MVLKSPSPNHWPISFLLDSAISRVQVRACFVADTIILHQSHGVEGRLLQLAAWHDRTHRNHESQNRAQVGQVGVRRLLYLEYQYTI